MGMGLSLADPTNLFYSDTNKSKPLRVDDGVNSIGNSLIVLTHVYECVLNKLYYSMKHFV
jgi:uncharacterized YccA/Bax inhibitor family protein